MLEELSSHQLNDWIAFNNISPFGGERLDFMLAQLCALLVNINRSEKSDPVSPSDFNPFMIDNRVKSGYLGEDLRQELLAEERKAQQERDQFIRDFERKVNES